MTDTDLRAIRAQSEAYCAERQILFNPDLPLVEGGPLVRDLAAVTDRCLVNLGLVVTAYNFDAAKVRMWFDSQFLWPAVDDIEKKHLKTPDEGLVEKDDLYAMIEGDWALMWALQRFPDLDPLAVCSDTMVKMLPDIKRQEPAAEFRRTSTLRGHGELVAMLDLHYCLHWSQVENTKQKVFKKVNDGTIPDRRRALEWLFTDEEWLETSLDT